MIKTLYRGSSYKDIGYSVKVSTKGTGIWAFDDPTYCLTYIRDGDYIHKIEVKIKDEQTEIANIDCKGKDWNSIVININGSHYKSTNEIVKGIKKNYPNIKLVVFKNVIDVGKCSTLNVGFRPTNSYCIIDNNIIKNVTSNRIIDKSRKGEKIMDLNYSERLNNIKGRLHSINFDETGFLGIEGLKYENTYELKPSMSLNTFKSLLVTDNGIFKGSVHTTYNEKRYNKPLYVAKHLNGNVMAILINSREKIEIYRTSDSYFNEIYLYFV